VDVDALANVLEQAGEYIRLRRMTGRGLYIEVRCAARITSWTPELYRLIAGAGGIAQGDQVCIMSNREIARRRWPGPPRRGDLVIIEDQPHRFRTATVQACDPSSLDGVICRYDMVIRGT
jgi:hypothetical protein